MKILVTGSEGFIGSHVMRLLPEATRFDLKLGNDVREGIPDADVIIHLAGSIDINESFDQPYEYFMNNTYPLTLLPRDSRVVFASSAAVYSLNSPYGLSKLLGEKLLPDNSVSLRIFNPFGADENHDPENHLIPNLMSGEATVYNNGEQIRNFIHVEDVARAIVFSALGNFTGVYDVCSDEPLSVREVVDLMDVPVNYKDSPRDTGDTKVLTGDNSGLRQHGWTPLVDVRQSLKEWRTW